MKRRYRRRAKSNKQETRKNEGKVVQLPLDSNSLMEMIRENVHQFAMEAAVAIAGQLLEDEVRQLCGPRYAHDSERSHVRYGSQGGVICIGGQKVGIDRPRVRTAEGSREIALKHYESLQADNAMPPAVMKRLVRGVSTRDYEGVLDLACDGFGVKKSSVSRQFISGSLAALKKLRERRFDDVRFAAILIDGVDFAEEMMIAAIGIDENGYKQVLGVRQGATENAQVCTELLEELVERGVDTHKPTLLILDGSKALKKAVKRVFGRYALIQRCQVHKKRNVQAHLSEELWSQISRRLSDAYNEQNYSKALQKLKSVLKWLDRVAPDAAASLREGMEETLTVVRLGVPELLRQSLASTNIIDSAFNGVRKLTRRVKRWRKGNMRLRWSAAGLLHVETTFRRVKGYRDIPFLLNSLERVVEKEQVDELKKAA